MSISRRDIEEIYGLENWGAGYFSVSRKGHLLAHPNPGQGPGIDVKTIVDALGEQRLHPPLLLRFPQIISSQIIRLHEAFARAIAEGGYRGQYRGVYPIKVNQRREVVTQIMRAGRPYDYGLEVGSKPELAMALAMHDNPHALLICNGLKDETFIRMALYGRMLGKNIVLVLENLGELAGIIRVAKRARIKPLLGIRVKLFSRGSGKWEEGGGELSKFGLQIGEVLQALEMLTQYGMQDALKMLHFHLGSQVTDIRRIKNAVREAARIYAKLYKSGVELEYLNVGGGLGIDYDGSQTPSDSSINYTVQEYANNVVYTIKEICEQEGTRQPTIVSESGRAVVAHHSLLIINVQRAVQPPQAFKDGKADAESPQIIVSLTELLDQLTPKNYRESYHDAIELQEELFSLFNLGYLSLEDWARGEALFWEVCRKAARYARRAEDVSDDFQLLQKALASKYICNFSVFQSVPDFWAIKQLFPIIPIHRLDEMPTEAATLGDITCDSDGKIDRFVDLKDVKDMLEFHRFDNGPYHLAVLFVGAYQDIIGDFHNLFGTVHEALITMDGDGEPQIEQVIPGDTIDDVLQYVRYDVKDLQRRFTNQVKAQVRAGTLAKRVAQQMLTGYRRSFQAYTYLVPDGCP
ncbi:MAG TPA: biosynthetic arginine decarboxylase [Alphaproteobacteria bacterium]|nr:biosynthetic arginine decarboxylase [Alphaproteobacteria bacterium]